MSKAALLVLTETSGRILNRIQQSGAFIAEYLGRLDSPTSKFCLEWLNNRLKFLRPQPHWKPSEEQMTNLAAYINSDIRIAKLYNIQSLYNDLKKLTEE